MDDNQQDRDEACRKMEKFLRDLAAVGERLENMQATESEMSAAEAEFDAFMERTLRER